MAELSSKMTWPWIRQWYQRYERPISSFSLIGGFVFDNRTLTRADRFWENFWIVIHLVAVGACIVLLNRERTEAATPERARKHFWLTNVLQFLFGGILSTYIVFYFRSATLAATWPFMLILIGAFVANDRLRSHRERMVFQVSLFFLSVFAFTIFVLPVVLHRIGPLIFLASGGVSLLAMWGFFAILRAQCGNEFQSARWLLLASVAAVFICFDAMYFLNLIPPLPLSLKDGEIVHSVVKSGPGFYSVREEDKSGWQRYVDIFTEFHEAPDDGVSAWSAIFSPPRLNLTIVHEWQFYDEAARRWVPRSRIRLKVIGGRDGGFRTYSTISHPSPGWWRVNMETEHGAVIGRIRFKVVPVTSPVPLKTRTKS